MKLVLFVTFIVVSTVTLVSSRRSVVDVVKEDTTWILRELSAVPAVTASLEYDIHFPAPPLGRRRAMRPIITFYYRGQKSPNLVERCERDMFGQFRNEDLAVPLNKLYRDKFFCYRDSEMVRCSGKTKIQDFEPKFYSFSLGFDCKRRNFERSLKGLYYNITISQESNQTSCVRIPPQGRAKIAQCQKKYEYAAIPNQIGNTEIDTAMFALTQGLNIMDRVLSLVKHKKCLRKVYQLSCVTVLPECKPEENRFVLPCREECEALLDDCLQMDVFARLAGKLVLNCDYLPSRSSGINCTSIQYKDEHICGPPPEINHGFILEGDGLSQGKEGDTAHYACEGSLNLCGAPYSTCSPSGEWTRPPMCKNMCMQTLIIIQVACFVVLVLFMVVIGYCLVGLIRKNMRQKQLKKVTEARSYQNAIHSRVYRNAMDPKTYQEAIYKKKLDPSSDSVKPLIK